MIISESCFTDVINSPKRQIYARVELFDGSTLVQTFKHTDYLQSFQLDRAGEEKFFGFGICQKLTVKLIDAKRELNITKQNTLEISFGVGCEYEYVCPIFYIADIERDEKTNIITITAYDYLIKAAEHTVAELDLPSYTIKAFAAACAELLELPLKIENVNDNCFDTYYEYGANFEGTESIREALDAIAGATQTIYYINSKWDLVFRRLDIDGEPVLEIGKDKYFELSSGTNHTLTNLCHATELGDNLDANIPLEATGEAIRFDDVIPGEHDVRVNVSSKNLIPFPYSGVSAGSGVTFTTNSDGSVTANGTASSNQYSAKYLTNVYKLPAGTYTLSSDNLTSNRELRGTIHNLDLSTDRYIYDETFTITSEKYISIHLVILAGNTVNNVTYHPILERGSVATGYTPYVKDVTNAAIQRGSKNIAPMLIGEGSNVIVEGVTFTGVADGGIAVSGTPTGIANLGTRIKAPIKSGKIAISLTGNYTNIVPDFKLINSAGATILQVQTGRERIVDLDLYPEAVEWEVAIKRELNNVAVSGTVYFQVELGDKVTAYEPYNSYTFYPEADGTVSDVSALSPTTTLYTEGEGVIITAKTHSTNKLAGTTQYVRDNPFWELRDDAADLVDNALAAVYGTNISQFDCSWRGNFLLEIGDKIALVTKDDQIITSYLLNDSITYDGGFSEKTSWSFESVEAETAANPTTLGDALRQTYAKVDKANKEITLLVSENEANKASISSLKMTTDSVITTVERVETNLQNGLESLNGDITSLTSRVEATMTAEEIEFAIQKEMSNGVDKVTTTTGFTFNEEGLTVSKSGSEMETQITEDGMTVYRDNTEVLVANNQGVTAEDLHATTYLIIGETSRFENYNGRTGCFWIGG